MKFKAVIVLMVTVILIAGLLVYRSHNAVTPEVKAALVAAIHVGGITNPVRYREAKQYIHEARLAARTDKDRAVCNLVEEYQEQLLREDEERFAKIESMSFEDYKKNFENSASLKTLRKIDDELHFIGKP
jgi:hypothetical protein